MALNPKQQRFVEEYLVDLNATQAAIRAGYSAKTAHAIAEKLLRKAEINEAIQSAMKSRSERTEVTQDRVIQELAAMAFYDPADLASTPVNCPADIAKLPEAVRRAIVGWSWDKHGNFVLKLSPKTPSIDLLAKHLGMLRERVEHTGADGQPLAPPIFNFGFDDGGPGG